MERNLSLPKITPSKALTPGASVQHPTGLASSTTAAAKTGFDFGGASSVLSGITSIFNTSAGLAKTADISNQNSTINEIENTGNQNYTSFDDIASSYNQISENNNNLDLSYDTIRGGSKGERVGGVLSSAATGAMTGLSVGGPWGAIAGAAVGLGAGLAGVFTGNAEARYTKGIKEVQAKQANEIAGENLIAATDRLKDSQFRSSYANRAALGGKIEREKTSMQAFADAVTRNVRKANKTHSAGFVHKHVDGGTMIRIKR